MCAVGKFVDKT